MGGGTVAGVLLASLLGSPHCAAMCGPFVAFYAGSAPASRAGTHVAYSLGRFIAYVSLGVLAGTLGASVDRIGALAGVSRLAAVVAGTMMVAWGLATILAWRGVRLPLPRGLTDQTLRAVTAVLSGSAPPLVKVLHSLEVAGDLASNFRGVPRTALGTVGASPAATVAGWLRVRS